MKRGLIQGGISGVLTLVIMLIYPPFTIWFAFGTATGVAIGNFIVGIIQERLS